MWPPLLRERDGAGVLFALLLGALAIQIMLGALLVRTSPPPPPARVVDAGSDR